MLEKLGSGAMGDVYLGYDPGRDERCAIKVLAGVYQEDEEALMERMLKERHMKNFYSSTDSDSESEQEDDDAAQ